MKQDNYALKMANSVFRKEKEEPFIWVFTAIILTIVVIYWFHEIVTTVN